MTEQQPVDSADYVKAVVKKLADHGALAFTCSFKSPDAYDVVEAVLRAMAEVDPSTVPPLSLEEEELGTKLVKALEDNGIYFPKGFEPNPIMHTRIDFDHKVIWLTETAHVLGPCVLGRGWAIRVEDKIRKEAA